MPDPRIPQTNFNPPFNITRASHLVFTVRDLATSRAFYTEVMGLIVSDEDANTLWLRGVEERAHHSLTLKKTSGQPQCERVGFRVFMDEDLDKAKAYFDRADIKAAFVDTPHQDRTLHFNDPAGTPVELVATMKTVPRMHTRIDTHRGAGALRMDHYQVLVPDVLATAKFYMELGFRISDYLYVEAAQRVVGTFLHRKDNPWDIVLLARSGPRFHHGAATWSKPSRTSCGPVTSPATLALPTASSTAPAATATSIRIISICAIRTAIAPNCCCPGFRSSTSTTSR